MEHSDDEIESIYKTKRKKSTSSKIDTLNFEKNIHPT